eukprot:sb/3471101/
MGSDHTHRTETTETSKQPIRTRYLGHMTGYQPIRDQYFLIRSVPTQYSPLRNRFLFARYSLISSSSSSSFSKDPCCFFYSHRHINEGKFGTKWDQIIRIELSKMLDVVLSGCWYRKYQETTETSKKPIRTRYLGHMTGYQPIRDQYFLIRSVPAQYSPLRNRFLFARYSLISSSSSSSVKIRKGTRYPSQ